MGVQKVIVLAEVSLQCPGELHDALAGERSAMLRVCVCVISKALSDLSG